jgi:hypothetical protein
MVSVQRRSANIDEQHCRHQYRKVSEENNTAMLKTSEVEIRNILTKKAEKSKGGTSGHGFEIANHKVVQHALHSNVIKNSSIVVHSIGTHYFYPSVLCPSLKMFHLDGTQYEYL